MSLRPAVLLCAAAAGCPAQFTLPQVVKQATESYPAVRASLEDASAAAAAIRLARTSYLPRADFLGQINRATHNNVFGMLLPQAVVPAISGPVLRTNSLGNVWGSAAGVLVSWEPFDFGLRKANVQTAERTRDRAGAQAEVTRFQVGVAAADAFLTLAAAGQAAIASRAGVERARVFDEVVQTLVKNELRPGADGSRARAELALAETQLIRAEQAVEEARAGLAQLLGIPSGSVQIDADRLLREPPPPDLPAAGVERHPLVLAQSAALEEVRAREKALSRTWYPRFNLQGATYARGTGVEPDGTTGGAASGLGPNIQNWGLGLSVTFPALEQPSLRARREVEAGHERAEEARYRTVVRELSGELGKARARLEGARRVAAAMPVQLAAAQAARQQATARYRAGLTGIAEVAEAQRLLTQTEIDDALARLSVWRATLAVAAASGDLSDFLRIAGR